MSRSRRAAKAASIILGALVVTVIVTSGLDQIDFHNLYTTRFAFEPGPWFSEHVAPAVGMPDYCLVVGPSTPREGLDTEVLGEHLPGLKIVNAATTGGNIEVVEVQAQILSSYGIHAKCIIVGVHPFLMMAQNPPLLASTGYLAQLNLTGLFLLSDRTAVLGEIGPIAKTIVLPLEKHAERLNKLVRFWIFELQEKYRPHPLPLRAYEYFADEFKPSARYSYNDVYAQPEAIAEQIKMRYATYTYDSSAPEVSFKRALTLLRKEADQVFVVTMPNQDSLVALNGKGRAAYDRAIDGTGISEIDCSGLVPNQHFIDDVHLDREGRRILSNAVGRIISRTVPPAPERISCN